MALSDSNFNQNNNQALNGQQVRVIYRFCSPPEDYDIQKDGFIPLTVIPIIDNNFEDGYYSDWDEVKNQILSVNFKDRNQIPNTISFVGKIGSGNCELPLITKEDYFTALKVAELCGQPLDVLIKASQDYNGIKESDLTKASTSKTLNDETLNHSISDSDNDTNDEKNGFVFLTGTPKVVNQETANNSSNKIQMSSQNDNIVLSKCQIEKLKKEITIDVTKRIISKLSQCLTELNIEEDSHSSDSAFQTNSNSDFVNNNENNLNSSSDEKTAQVIHYGIICDNCETQIKGIRYKCSVCLDYDLCEKCELLPGIHNEDHSFIKIKQYIKPFQMPNKGEDIYLALDVDLPTGKINIGDLKVVSKPKTSRSTSTTQPAEQSCSAVNAEQTAAFSPDSKTSLNGPKLESDVTIGSHSHPVTHTVPKVKMSDKKAMKIAKKLEKLRIKGQIYSNLLQSSDERSARHESKSSTSGTHSQHQPVTGNKTLFLSGLFVGDETIPEGTQMPPGTKFRKTWRIRNTGTKVWTGRTTLRYVWGHSELEPFGKVIEVQAPQLKPGEEGKVAIRFQAPKSPGVYQSHWRLHHRGQPFGQRLICKVVIDPNVSGITQPIVIGMKVTEPMPPIAEQKATTTALSDARFENQEKSAINPIKHKTQASKHLHEALTAVKEIRFSLDNNESIPMKANVKSHTTTPTNTPFDVSPPKSPEPSLSTSLTQIESNENNETNSNEDKNGENLVEDKSNDAEDADLASVLSLSGSEASDDFVIVPLPRCFDLNVPFCETDNTSAQVNCIRDGNILETDVTNANCFQDVYEENRNEFIEQNNCDANDLIDNFDENSPILDDLNDFSEYTVADEAKDMNVATDLSTNKIETNQQNQNEASEQVLEAKDETPKASAPQKENESQNRQKPVSPSTNPFRDSCNETENVIHVLPESIVTGALSAAAHVYNNVSRALFPRNEGNSDSRHFAWITSPPPAAIPLPERYWDPPRGYQYQPQEYFSTTSASTNSTSTTTSKNAGIVTTTSAPSSVMASAAAAAATAETQRNRLSDAMTQLYEMGFWNQRLNQELLEKNKYDVNDTIEDLLSPERGRQRRTGGSDEVVSRQPKHNRSDFIEEFD